MELRGKVAAVLAVCFAIVGWIACSDALDDVDGRGFRCGERLQGDPTQTQTCAGEDEVCVCSVHACAARDKTCDGGFRYLRSPFGNEQHGCVEPPDNSSVLNQNTGSVRCSIADATPDDTSAEAEVDAGIAAKDAADGSLANATDAGDTDARSDVTDAGGGG